MNAPWTPTNGFASAPPAVGTRRTEMSMPALVNSVVYQGPVTMYGASPFRNASLTWSPPSAGSRTFSWPSLAR